MLYQSLLKPIFFRMNPENAHHMMMNMMKAAARTPGGLAALRAMYAPKPNPMLAMDLFGVRFANPIGLAAGLDKNAEAVPGFSSIGFGFMEVGTVTPKPQPGNDKPRSFRLPEDEALINRMGFNNEGIDRMAERLQQLQRRPVPIAVNIGKNKATPNEQAVDDYVACLRRLYAHGDYFVVNISSPNTPDLRKLQHGEELQRLLEAVVRECGQLGEQHGLAKRKAVLVKIAPDLNPGEIEDIMSTVTASGVDGVIATNTTLSRDGLRSPNGGETGGLSGKPLKARSTEVIRAIYASAGGRMPIIGSGGIFSAEDAYEKIRAGASLIEVYTGMIYRGPDLIRGIHDGLARLLERDGYKHLSEAIGADHR